MKAKNISFAQVLKKKGKLSQVEPQKSSMRLVEMMQQWEVYPNEDYTLRLGNFGFSQKSNQSTIPMFCSKNVSKDQEEMFDSWIQRQSFITNNKENIGIQPKKIQKNIVTTGAVKITLSSKGRDASKNTAPRTMTQMMRQTEVVDLDDSNQIHESNRSNKYFHSNTQIPPPKNNFYQKQPRIEGMRSPKIYKPEEQDLNLEIQEVMMKGQPKEECKIRTNQISNRDFNLISEQKLIQVNKPMSENEVNCRKATKLQQIISCTENIHEEIADLAHQYVRERHPNHTEQDEELLIDESIQRAPIQQLKRQTRFEDQYSEVMKTNEDDQKRRMEEAKSVIEGYVKNMVKVKFNTIHNQNHSSTLSPKTNINSEYRKGETNPIPSYLDVGYSFASNVIDDTRKDESIERELKAKPQPEQQPKEERLQQSEDLNFRNKYINIEPAIVSEEHIQNIESIGYENENDPNNFAEQAKACDNIPNLSFEVKLINSNGRKSQTQQCSINAHQYPSTQQEIIESKPQLFVSIPNNYEFSDNAYRNGLAKKQESKQISGYRTSNDKANDYEVLFTKKQIYGNYNFANCRDKLTIKMSPKTITQITSNQKVNEEPTNNYQYISRPFDANLEQPKAQNQITSETEKVVPKAESPKPIKQELVNKTQKESFSITFQVKQAQPFSSPPTEPKKQPIAANVQSPSYFSTLNQNNYGQPTFKYNPSTTTYMPTSTHATYSTCTPSYGNYGAYQPSKITFISPKAYEKSDTTPNATYGGFVSNFQPLKSENVPGPSKAEITSPKIYQQKYNFASTYENKIDKTDKPDKSDKPEKKNFLSQLAIKQSITVEQQKPKKHIPLISKSIKSSITKVEPQPVPALRQSIRQSIKESIKLQNSGEFQFQF